LRNKVRIAGPFAGWARGLRAAGDWLRRNSWLAAWAFAAVTVAPVLLAMAWLLPGAGMLLAGRLLPEPMLIIFIPLAVALCYFTMRRLPAAWPRFGPRAEAFEAASSGSSASTGASASSASTGTSAGGASSGDAVRVPFWTVVATVAIAAGFVVWQAMYRSQQDIVTGGPGEYLQYAYWIAHHGTARIAVSPSDFGPSIGGLRFDSPGFMTTPGSTGLSPAFMAGLPLVLAGGFWMHGIGGALLMTPLLGGCAVLSFAGLAGRLVGARWAPAAALVLAVTLPEQYASRTTLSEPLVQILLFGGLCLILDSLAVRRRLAAGPEGPAVAASEGLGQEGPGSGDTASEGTRGPAWQAMTLAAFGGLAIGLTVLADIGSLSLVLPAFPFLALLYVGRMPQAGPMAGGLLIGIGGGVVTGTRLSRPYLTSLGPQLHDIGLAAAGFGVATALIAPLAFPAIRAAIRRVLLWRLPVQGLTGTTHRVPVLAALLEGLVVLAPAAAFFGLLVRPQAQITRGTTDPYTIAYVANLQRLAGLPVDGRQQYYEQSLNWVIWYVGLPVVLLACIGFALIGRRCLRALLRWRGAAPAARLWGLPLFVFSAACATVLWDPATYPDQPWASRRLATVVLPGLICLALWICSRVLMRASELNAGRIALFAVSACSVLALAIPAAVTSFDPGYVDGSASQGAPAASKAPVTRHLAVRGMALTATFGGEKTAVRRLCAAISPSSSVIMVDVATADAFSQVVRGMCNIPTARTDGAPPAVLEQVIAAVERTGRHPVLLGRTQQAVAVVGAVPQRILSLTTTQDAHDLNSPPAAPWPLIYTLWMSSPAGA
jgi:hypothetical protein